MAFAQIINGQAVECVNPIVLPHGNVSPESVALWSDEERAEAEIYTIVEPTPDPDLRPTGFELQIVGDEVHRVVTTTAKREIPKSTVQQRIEDIGKLDDLYDMLTAPGTPKKYILRWQSPDWPNVFFDDPDMLMMLGAIGCTAEEIAGITAAE